VRGNGRGDSNVLSTKLSDIDEALLRAVCAESWSESGTLEFKQILPRAGDTDAKLEFVKDVSALANSNGGDLVYGISEKAGAAHSLIPIADAVDPVTRRLDQVLEAGVEPRIQGIQYRAVDIAGGGYVLVMRVPASFSGPHRCVVERRFVMRANSRTSDMSYDQVRSAFDRTATLIDRARRFRDERIDELIHRKSWKGKTDGPICAFHVIPLSALTGQQAVDLQLLLRESKYIGLETWRAGGWNWTYNLDGLAAYTSVSDGLPLAGATQYYRNGAMEAIFALGAHLRPPQSKKRLPGIWLSEFVREAASRFFPIARELGVVGPAIIGVTLLHVQDYDFGVNQVYNVVKRSFTDRNHLVLPETWIDDISVETDVDAMVRPVLDVLWQCFGADLCLIYDADGKWHPDKYQS
jgi:hypothetical protein